MRSWRRRRAGGPPAAPGAAFWGPVRGAPRILVTGASGFAGRHLLRALEDAFPGYEPYSYGGPGCTTLPPLDVTDPASADAVIAQARPEMIVHLAGQADAAAAGADPDAAMRTNAGGTQTMVEAALKHAPSALFLAISSSEVYGDSLAGGAPTPETRPLQPAFDRIIKESR